MSAAPVPTKASNIETTEEFPTTVGQADMVRLRFSGDMLSGDGVRPGSFHSKRADSPVEPATVADGRRALGEKQPDPN